MLHYRVGSGAELRCLRLFGESDGRKVVASEAKLKNFQVVEQGEQNEAKSNDITKEPAKISFFIQFGYSWKPTSRLKIFLKLILILKNLLILTLLR